jgi:type III pantothenate kinase
MSITTLLFDIGNTNIKIGFADDAGIRAQFTLPTDPRQTADGLGLGLAGLCRHMNVAPESLRACVASSVAPVVAHLVKKACHTFLGLEPLFAPEDIPIPLENKYARPQEVGADRLVGAYAARRLMPKAKSIISVDFGTATTFDFVTDSTYLGGLICPGVYSSVEALASRTAKLPHIALDIDAQEPAIGKSTAESINHGFVFGFAAMTEGLCARLAKTLPGPVESIATGGFAQSLARVTPCFTQVRPDLLLEGLRLLYAEAR